MDFRECKSNKINCFSCHFNDCKFNETDFSTINQPPKLKFTQHIISADIDLYN
jgi:cytochrome c